MFTKLFPIAVAVAIAMGVIVEVAFTRTRVFTIADALKQAETSVFTIRGRVTPVGPNSYILTDSTGSADLETCPTWYRRIRLEHNEQVTVTGELIRRNNATDSTLYELAVHKIIRSGKPEIVLRTEPGQPPWASGELLPPRKVVRN